MRQPLIVPMLLAITCLAGHPAPGAQVLPGQPAVVATPRERPQAVDRYVDINSASRKELMTLPGVGPAEADRIAAHRPYLTKTELVTKGVMPAGPFLSLKNQLVAMQVSKKGKDR